MRALALDGDRAGALQEYEILTALLAKELGTQPGTDCEALAERVRRERGRRRASAQAEPERRRAPLIGRGADLERLWQVWHRQRAARSAACALIVGDPGMGKTRLGDEVASRVRLDGATTSVIRAVESDRTVPWSGLVGLARGGLLEAPGLAGAPAAALAWFARRIPEWADRFATASGVEPEAPARALSEVLRAGLNEQPIALVLDDVTLLDRESMLAIDAALRDHAKRPLFVVLSTSAHVVRPEIDELRARIGRDVDGIVVHLDPFGSEDVGALARWALPSYKDAQLDRVTRRVHTDSAGVPLLVVELLSAVAVGFDLDRTRGAWPQPLHTLDDTLPGNLPEGVTGAIRVWYRRLSPVAQRVLQATAVLEDRVAAGRLACAVGLPLETANEALDELEWSRWLTCDGRGYAFVARIVRQVVNEDMVTPGQRQRIRDAAGPLPGPPSV
jgi:AAA ATPase-like protein/transcriptional activator